MQFTNIDDALLWLDDHIDYERTPPKRRALPKLETMRRLTEAIGLPERELPAIHVTGTNGKGSVTAISSTLLSTMGLKVGSYTSPNLARVNERLAIAGEPIDDESFTEVLSHLSLAEPTLTDRPTRFELLTAAAFWWFADSAVDAAVIEVGLGGTWDCTNVIDAEVAVVTNVSYDHTDVLGPTLEGIATDKAGIIKSGATAIIGEVDPALIALIKHAADEEGAKAKFVRTRDYDCTSNQPAIGGRLLNLRTPAGATYDEVYLPLFGAHQGENAATALAATEAFLGRTLEHNVVEEACAAVKVPGRLEVAGRHPLLLLDGAHNAAGVLALARALTDEFDVSGPRIAVVGMLVGRDPVAMLAPLRDAGVTRIYVSVPVTPRAMPAEEIAEAARSLGIEAVIAATVRTAIDEAREAAGTDGLVAIAGSLYLVAEARAAIVPPS